MYINTLRKIKDLFIKHKLIDLIKCSLNYNFKKYVTIIIYIPNIVVKL